MQIQWFGLGCFSISGKIASEEVTCVTDPFSADFGIRPPRAIQGGMVIQSHAKGYADNIDLVQASEEKPVFSISHAGEYESHGIFVNGVHAPTKGNHEHTIYRILFEDISIGFLGALDRKLTDSEIEALGDIHILIMPVGGDDVLSPNDAADVAAQVEPRIVIPSYYHTDGLKTKHGTVESFIKSIGVTPVREQKYKITKSGLPEEDMGLVILEA
jgi:hypothetical protein